ncbi:glutathione S-transferase family protein [Cognatiyoonia sp.]|uniref:glutathione S-transferase family protein n=1 Tax=Cognatiyoonia sp. TaxID=2211652 RepID=UPI003F696A49
MQLIMSSTSPFVRKIRVLTREAKLTDVVEEVTVVTTPLASAAEALAANPLGKIPTSVRNEGPTLYDSSVISRYLDDYANANLYPASRLWEVLTLEATGNGIMEATVSMTYEARLRPEAQQSPYWIEAQWNKATRALDALGDRWLSHLEGPLTMGQISVGCALSCLDFRHDARGWREGREALANWHAGFAARDSMTATTPG